MDESQAARTPFQTVRGILYLVLGAGALALCGVYFLLAPRFGVRLIEAWLPGVAMAAAFALIGAGLIRLFTLKSIPMRVIAFILAACAALALRYACISAFSDTMLRSTSPDGRTTCLIAWDKETGAATYYRQRYVLFCQEKDQLPYTMDGEPKMQWFSGDACAVTYPGNDGTTHQFVATYGDRGSGYSYYYMAAAIHGNWQVMSQDAVGWKLAADTNGITLSNATMTEHYDYDDCVPFGTIALALCRDGLPQWTLVMDENCSIGEDCLIESGGTLTLCEVSMERTAPLTFSCTDYKG